MRFLLFLLISHLVFQLPAPYILKTYGSNTVYYKLVNLVYMMLAYGVFHNLLQGDFIRKIVRALFIISIGFLILRYAFNLWDITTFGESKLVQGLFQLSCALIFFWEMLNYPNEIPLLRHWKFLVVSGFFVYNLLSVGASLIEHLMVIQDYYYFNIKFIQVTVYLLELILFLFGSIVYVRQVRTTEANKDF